MQDIYLEYLVKRKPIIMMKVLFVLCVMMTAINLVFCLVSPFAIFLVLAFFGLAFLVRRYSDIEYEYIMTNDTLDIEAIYRQEKRKCIKSINLSQASLIAPLSDPAFGGHKDAKGFDYSSHEQGAKRLGILVVNPKNNREEITAIEPDEEMRQAFARRYPNVFRA